MKNYRVQITLVSGEEYAVIDKIVPANELLNTIAEYRFMPWGNILGMNVMLHDWKVDTASQGYFYEDNRPETAPTPRPC